MQTDSIEKAVGIGAIGLWAALHGWLGWLVVLYAVCMMLDWVTGTVLAIKNGVWSSHKARQGLWHKCGSIIMIFVSVLTDILLGLTLNHISGLTLPFNYDMLLTPIALFWYIVSELGSILENAEKMGAPIPPLLKNVLEKMRDSNDDKNASSLQAFIFSHKTRKCPSAFEPMGICAFYGFLYNVLYFSSSWFYGLVKILFLCCFYSNTRLRQKIPT